MIFKKRCSFKFYFKLSLKAVNICRICAHLGNIVRDNITTGNPSTILYFLVLQYNTNLYLYCIIYEKECVCFQHRKNTRPQWTRVKEKIIWLSGYGIKNLFRIIKLKKNILTTDTENLGSAWKGRSFAQPQVNKYRLDQLLSKIPRPP